MLGVVCITVYTLYIVIQHISVRSCLYNSLHSLLSYTTYQCLGVVCITVYTLYIVIQHIIIRGCLYKSLQMDRQTDGRRTMGDQKSSLELSAQVS